MHYMAASNNNLKICNDKNDTVKGKIMKPRIIKFE